MLRPLEKRPGIPGLRKGFPHWHKSEGAVWLELRKQMGSLGDEMEGQTRFPWVLQAM